MRAKSRTRWLCSLAATLSLACGDEPETAAESAAREEPAAAAQPAAQVGTTLIRAPLPLPEAIARYEADCGGSRTPECKQLQWQLEYALYLDLRELGRLGAIEEELIRVGAAADCPQLKAFSLEHLQARGLRPGEDALVIAAFDDPYPTVRAVAHQLSHQLADPAWARMLTREAGWREDGVRGFVAGRTPGEKALGAPLYPGATHWLFASSNEFGEFFTTGDDPDDVIEFYAKDSKRALSGDELTAQIQAATDAARDPAQLAQRMQDALDSGQDPAALMSALSAGATGIGVDWTQGIDGREGVVEPRFVVLAAEEFAGRPVPARVVAIFRDEAMGKTALVFRSKPRVPQPPDLSTPEAVDSYMRLQQWLASPEAQLD